MRCNWKTESPDSGGAASCGLKRFRIALVIGFAAMLGLVLFVTSTGLNNLEALQDRFSNIRNNHMAKIELTTRMYHAARQRVVIMQKMTMLDDPFERDELSMQMHARASEFAEARMSLIEMSLTPQEQQLLALQGKRTGTAIPLQRSILDMLAEDRIEEAKELLVNEAIQAQDRVLAVLDQIYQLQLESASVAATQAQKTYRETRMWMGSSALGALLLGIVIATSVVVRTSRAAAQQEKQLSAIEEMNQALIRNTEELARANEDARQSSESKSAFLANMSHEIRTPLTAIIGFSDSLRENRLLKDEGYDAAETITRNGKHLLHLINSILDLSKIEAGKLDLEIMPVSPCELLEDIRATVQLAAQEAGLELLVDYQFPLPATIDTDLVRMKQILLNICNNAIKFTDKGRVRMHLSLSKAHDSLTFSITDTGIGMTPEQIDKVFDAFAQADTSTTRKYGGTGLGLTICKLLADRLGAQLSVRSKPGYGACFELSLPVSENRRAELIEQAPRRQEYTELPVNTLGLIRGSVLVVDDSTDNQKLISLYLKQAGAEFCIANNGREAVEKALTHDFDLILMDLQMPLMDGLEATGLIRGAGNATPIVALTANAMKEDIARCHDAGCSDFLAKPIDKAAFLEVLGAYLEPDNDTIPPEAETAVAPATAEPEHDPVFQELVAEFRAGLPLQMQTFRETFGRSDWDGLAAAAHMLKGMGGSFGHPELTEHALALETAAKQCSHQETELVLETLERRIRELTVNPAAAPKLAAL